MPPLAMVIFLGLLIPMLATILLVIAARTYSSLAANPWWRLPKPRLVRFLVLYALSFLGGSVLYALLLVVTRREHFGSLSDVPQVWIGAIEAGLIFFVPGVLLGHGWYALTHWRAARRAATSS